VPRCPWIIATATGALLAWLIGAAVVMSLPEDQAFEDSLPLFMALGPVLGALLGGCQWVVLRRHVSGAGWWVVANAAGWGIGLLVGFGIPALSPPRPSSGCCAGCVSGHGGAVRAHRIRGRRAAGLCARSVHAAQGGDTNRMINPS
jgi:hypothetical protein